MKIKNITYRAGKYTKNKILVPLVFFIRRQLTKIIAYPFQKLPFNAKTVQENQKRKFNDHSCQPLTKMKKMRGKCTYIKNVKRKPQNLAGYCHFVHG